MATLIELDGVTPTIGLSERQTVAPGVLAAGVPAREKKPLTGSAEHWTRIAADDYQHLRQRYLATSVVTAT